MVPDWVEAVATAMLTAIELARFIIWITEHTGRHGKHRR